MTRRAHLALTLILLATPALAANRITVTVVDPKSGKAVTDLKAEDFTILEDKLTRKAEAAEYTAEPIDVMFLLDTSLVGATVRPFAEDLVAQLKPKEQMAVVSFHSSA